MVKVTKKKLFVVKEKTKSFNEGDIVESFIFQPRKNELVVTNYEKIESHNGCKCKTYKAECIKKGKLELLGKL